MTQQHGTPPPTAPAAGQPATARTPRRRRWGWLAVAAVVVIGGGVAAWLLVAGSSGPAIGVNYRSALSIAEALQDNGFPCTERLPNTTVLEERQEVGCNHGDSRIVVRTFPTADQPTPGGTGSGQDRGWSVSGDRWAVSGITDRRDADRVARILGGTVRSG